MSDEWKGYNMDVKEAKGVLDTIHKGISTRWTLPVLSGVVIERDRAWATDLETTVIVQGDYPNLGQPGSPEKMIVDRGVLKKVLSVGDPKRQVTYLPGTEADDGRLVVAVGDAETKLNTMTVEDMPPLMANLDSPDVTLNVGGDFIDEIVAVQVAASTDDSRQVLTQVYLEVGKNEVSMTATDSYRLHTSTLPTISEREFVAFIPRKRIAALPNDQSLVTITAKLDDAGTTDWFTISQGNVTLLMNHGSVWDYPNWRQLVPANKPEFAFDVDLDDKEIARRMKGFIKLQQNNLPVTVDWFDKRLDLTMTIPDVLEHSDFLQGSAGSKTNGQGNLGLRIGFHPDFMSQAFAFAGTRLEANDSLKPAVISGKGDRKALLMPVRLG